MLGDGQYKWQLNQISLKIKELKVHCQQVLLQKKIGNDLNDILKQINKK